MPRRPLDSVGPSTSFLSIYMPPISPPKWGGSRASNVLPCWEENWPRVWEGQPATPPPRLLVEERPLPWFRNRGSHRIGWLPSASRWGAAQTPPWPGSGNSRRGRRGAGPATLPVTPGSPVCPPGAPPKETTTRPSWCPSSGMRGCPSPPTTSASWSGPSPLWARTPGGCSAAR